jgi:hypothetical protein
MKYSQLLGLLACIAQVFICFMPWSVVAQQNILITGMNAAVETFGRPGLLHIILSLVLSTFFAIQTIWAKRINVVIAAINLAWSFRNFLLMSVCHGGECPQKKTGIYLLVSVSFFILIMSFLPPIKIQPQQQQ